MSLSTASSCTGCYYSLIPHTNWNASKVLTQTVIQNHIGNLYISFDLYRSRETEEWLLEMNLSFWRRWEAGTEDGEEHSWRQHVALGTPLSYARAQMCFNSTVLPQLSLYCTLRSLTSSIPPSEWHIHKRDSTGSQVYCLGICPFFLTKNKTQISSPLWFHCRHYHLDITWLTSTVTCRIHQILQKMPQESSSPPTR